MSVKENGRNCAEWPIPLDYFKRFGNQEEILERADGLLMKNPEITKAEFFRLMTVRRSRGPKSASHASANQSLHREDEMKRS